MAGDNHAVAGAALPRHIAIIMDGNGRWATKRGLPRTAGHKVGAETFRTIAYYCKDLGIKYLTVYAFSTENWKRSADEVGVIMALMQRYLLELMELMARDHFRIHFSGDLTALSPNLQKLAQKADEIARSLPDDYCMVNACVNYGGRDEILRAARKYAADCVQGTRTPQDLDDNLFSSYMDSAGIPDPELIIRPSGEIRLSNFLLWQCAYSEFYFTDVLWPDFTPAEIDRAIAAYGQRRRRFGGVTQ
ncbi:MAG: di-trans,poly-cis-decaprenylcistransferase [Oscillibacter sp.]|nr:di-trans,poly-cis-decaprenylcistransferase [Oscillibacter sp.]